MNQQELFRKYLLNYLAEVQAKNSAFSMRSLAKRARLNPAALSTFLNGKRNFSSAMILQVGSDLGLPPDQLLRLKNLEESNTSKVSKFTAKQLKEKIQLNLDQYYIVSDWHYFAVLSLIETIDFKNDVKWIAKKLDTKEAHIEVVLERLIRLGYIKKEKNKLVLKEVILETSDDVPNTSLKKRHDENFDAAKEAIYSVGLDRRDFSFSTVAINPDKLPQAKKMIREFRDKLLRCLEEGDKKEVYEVCFQLFPRTKENDE